MNIERQVLKEFCEEQINYLKRRLSKFEDDLSEYGFMLGRISAFRIVFTYLSTADKTED